MTVAARAEARIRAMGLTDTESAKVLRRFEEARRERRAWLLAGVLLLVVCMWTAWMWGRWMVRVRQRTRARAKAADGAQNK